MERYNAMGREYSINDEVMCLDEDGEFVYYEDAQAEIDRLRGHLRDVQGELLVRFDNHELPDLNMVEIAQRIDKWLSTDEAGD